MWPPRSAMSGPLLPLWWIVASDGDFDDSGWRVDRRSAGDDLRTVERDRRLQGSAFADRRGDRLDSEHVAGAVICGGHPDD